MRILGLVGPKGSGKDASYDILREHKKVDGKISFAGPLKEICGKVFNLHFNLLNDPVLKEKEMKEPITLTRKAIKSILRMCEEYVPAVQKDGRMLYRSEAVSVTGLEGRTFKTPRELMQIIGTELIRDRVYKPWHREAAFSERALLKLKKTGVYAVTDVRFLDEHTFLEDKYGSAYKPYYVDRPEASAKLEASIKGGNAHPSETETQRIRELLADSTIENHGTLEDLKDLVLDLDLGSEEKEAAATKGSRFRFASKE